jgi:hypothetical protein
MATINIPSYAAASGGAGQPNVYGRRPDPVAMPTPYEDLGSVYPNLGESTGELSSSILAQLRGELSPGAMRNIVSDAAAFGVNSGLIGSEFGGVRGTNRAAQAREGQTQRGIQNLLSALPTVQRVGTVDPSLQTQIRTQNNVWDAAPDPTAANMEAQNLYQRQLNALSSNFNPTQYRPQSVGGQSMWNPSPATGGGWGPVQVAQGTGGNVTPAWEPSGQAFGSGMGGGGMDDGYNWVTDPEYDWLFDTTNEDPSYYSGLGEDWMAQNPDFNPADWE